MKKLCLLVCGVIAVMAVNAQTIQFSKEKPIAGQPLTFTYNPAGGKLTNETDVKCLIQSFVGSKQIGVPVNLTREGNVYKGTYTPVDSTSISVFMFSGGGKKEMPAKGFYTLFYENDRPTAYAYIWEYQYYTGMGEAFVGEEIDKRKALAALYNAFELDPSFKSTYLVTQLNIEYSLDKVKGEQLIRQQIKEYSAINPIKEDDLLKVSTFYKLLKKTQQSDSVLNILTTKFPTGNYVYNKKINEFYGLKDPKLAEERYKQIVNDFKLDPNKPSDAAKFTDFYAQLATLYGNAKQNDKFIFWSDKVKDKLTLASIYNSFAWNSAEKKDNVDFAAGISKKSLDLINLAKLEPKTARFSTQDAYINSLKSSYYMYADTYALLLAHQGKYAEALKYQEEAVNGNQFSSPDMNARYVEFLAKNKQTAKVTEFAERFIKAGEGSEIIANSLKAVYKGSIPFDTYYASLERDHLEKEKEKLKKEMINMPAPTFALSNLKGETVDLAKLKGKIVVLDYWATWCVPCINSFPGMQKSLDKYKNDPNVVFLFINTFQNEAEREKVVKDYMKTTTYTFNVLLDTKNVNDPSKFDVVSSYGVNAIPTKFIIDGDGNIRFKKVGGGTTESIVKEMDMLISLTKEASK